MKPRLMVQIPRAAFFDPGSIFLNKMNVWDNETFFQLGDDAYRASMG